MLDGGTRGVACLIGALSNCRKLSIRFRLAPHTLLRHTAGSATGRIINEMPMPMQHTIGTIRGGMQDNTAHARNY